MPLLKWKVIDHHAEGCIETIWCVHKLIFVFGENLKELQRPKVGLCRTSGIIAKILTLFSQKCHYCSEKSLIIMQKDVLKLFDMFISSYLFLVKTLKNHKGQKLLDVGPQGLWQKINDTFSKERHYCSENSLIIMQEDVLKLFEMSLSLNLFLMKTL